MQQITWLLVKPHIQVYIYIGTVNACLMAVSQYEESV